MDINKQLKDKFELVNKAYFDKEAGINYLRIEVNLRQIEDIAALSREISSYLDVNDPTEEVYYLDVFSPGTDESFDPKDSNEFIGQNIFITLKKNLKDKKEFIGELLSFENDEIIVRWNAKGQFRKQPIAIDNIESIKKYTKIKK